MPFDTQTQNEGLISLKDYLVGWLSISWRLPSIIRTTKHLFNMDSENLESWGSMLEENALKYPNNLAIKSEEANFTYKQYNEWTNRYANYFIARGLKKGDTAVVFLENRPELLIVYSAMAKIGAVNSMINTNLRQNSLRHCLTINPADLFIIGEEVIDAFEEIKTDLHISEDQLIYYLPDKGKKSAPAGFIDLKDIVKDYPVINPPTPAKVEPSDTIAYVFTSGTTGGMPKAAIITHGRLVRSRYYNGKVVLNIKPEDTVYIPLPFFHTNALALSWPCVFANGAAVAIRRKFSVSNFWDDIRKYDVTVWCYIGELCRYLINQPPKPDDRKNPLKKIIGNGLRPDIWKDFKRRFDIPKVYEIYGAAESNLYFVNLLNLDCTVGMCKLPYTIVKYDVDEDEPIRDDNGIMQPVEVGESGLLLGEITEENPFVGYTSKEATESKILRDVFTKDDAWFNTGDLIRDIGFKHVQFVDRTGDTFRWKGENVSTTAVEEVVDTFPQISMSTVYGVLMPGGEGRAGMAAIISATKPEDFDFQGLAEHFQRVLPSYSVPKFIRFKTQFEYTPTHKIKKVNLKKEGFNPEQVADPLYVLLPGESKYKPLTEEFYSEIMAGRCKF
jgi:acyl-CoA synthetase (AMP-forming)/AMP-acid ligase II